MAPATVGIHHWQHRQHMASFLRRFRRTLLQEESDVVVDFSHTRKMEAPGTLLFMAELDRALRIVRQGQQVTCKLPSSECHEAQLVREVLHQIGALDLMSYDTSHLRSEEYHETVRHWRYATGTRVDETPGDLLEHSEGRVAEALMQGMHIGVAEAITNCLHHAYAARRDDGCAQFNERRWWMFTAEQNGMLEVVVCDLGIGIRRSLPMKWPKSVIGKIFKALDRRDTDTASIQLALIIGETSTGEENRGRGLPQIWNAIRSADVGQIHIMSDKGFVGYEADGQKDLETQYSTSILGTVISWKVPIDATSDANG